MRAFLVLAALVVPAHAAPDLTALTKTAPVCDAKRATCIGLSLHVTVDKDVPIATPEWIAEQLVTANRHFEPLGVGFQITSVDALPATAARVANRKDRDAFRPQVTGTTIHVFVTGRLDDIDKPGEVIRGVTWRHGETKFVILSTIAMDRVLAHELGHVFGLPHSTYAVSIMNKSDRKLPPVELRTFADQEILAMRPKLATLLRTGALANLARNQK